MPVLPPGTILQHLYLKERLRYLNPGRFVDVGCGQGFTSRILLDAGWRGTGYDLNPDSLSVAAELNSDAVAQGRYSVANVDWLDGDGTGDADLVISCCVLEHLSAEQECRFLDRAAREMTPRGLLILIVPGSPRHWGIEDEIAGHFRRYTYDGLRSLVEARGWKCVHSAGLTYPLGNFLLPLSNALVKRAERSKRALSMAERTKLSGNRNVPFKTRFPSVLNLILNEQVLWPLHLLQKVSSRNPDCLILFGEFQPSSLGSRGVSRKRAV